ncbi:MAG: methionyl-tRNA formyltransferase [Actinomycetota bacterium]
MRAVFFGTPAEAVPSLEALAGVAEVVLVTTRPDRPRGRSGRPQPPPVKEAAQARGLPVSQPVRAAHDLERLRALAPHVAVVVAYGQILPAEVLAVPEHGFVNVHFSLLPRWRGASPVVRTILAGDELTGVTLMQLDAGMDTGPVLAVAPTRVRPEESAGELTTRLAGMGAGMLVEHLPIYVTGALALRPQLDEGATAAARVRVEEAFVDPTRHRAGAVLRAVRAFDPKPGAWTELDGGRLKLWRARPATGPGPEPGVVEAAGGAVLLGAADGTVELVEVQPEGRNRMAAADWMRGRRRRPARFTRPEG